MKFSQNFIWVQKYLDHPDCRLFINVAAKSPFILNKLRKLLYFVCSDKADEAIFFCFIAFSSQISRILILNLPTSLFTAETQQFLRRHWATFQSRKYFSRIIICQIIALFSRARVYCKLVFLTQEMTAIRVTPFSKFRSERCKLKTRG